MLESPKSQLEERWYRRPEVVGPLAVVALIGIGVALRAAPYKLAGTLIHKPISRPRTRFEPGELPTPTDQSGPEGPEPID